MNLYFMILHRYIIRRQVGPFLFSLLVITLLFLLNLAFRVLGRILSKGLEFTVVLEFFLLNLAWILALTVPMAVLTSVLMAFGSLSGDNEITAMKASGVSLYRMISFNLIVAGLLAVFLMWFNNAVLPNFNHRARMLHADINAKRPTLKLEPGVLLSEAQFNIFVEKILEEKENISRVAGVTIFNEDDQQTNKTIVAKEAIIEVDENNSALVLKLFNGEVHEIDWKNPGVYRKLSFPAEHIIRIKLPGLKLMRREDGYYSDREKSAQVMWAEVQQNETKIVRRNQKINQVVTQRMAQHLFLTPAALDSGKFAPNLTFNPKRIYRTLPARSQKISVIKPSEPAAIRRFLSEYRALVGQVKSEKNMIHAFQRNSYVLLVEIHKKYSIPIACIVFVLVGAPLGILSRRGNMAASGGIGLFFFILYWAFLIAGEELADRQIITPAAAMWAPNIVVGIFGIYLVFSVVKEMKFINFSWASIVERWVRFTSGKKKNTSNEKA